jgi:hypothetical protein
VALRELAERSGGGIVVRLFWNDSAPAGSDLSVEYLDEGEGMSYILYPSRDRVLEAFYHPNAYASSAVYASAELRAAS